MKKSLSAGSILIFILVLALAVAEQLSDRVDTAGGEVYVGTVVGIGPSPALSRHEFKLRLKGVTSDEERKRHSEILSAGGQGALLAEVRGRKLGFFQIAGQPGSDVRVAHRRHTEQGVVKLVLLFERAPSAFAARAGEGSEVYPFAYIEMYISGDGKFEGVLVPAARVGYADGDAALGDFGAYPARLVGSQRP